MRSPRSLAPLAVALAACSGASTPPSRPPVVDGTTPIAPVRPSLAARWVDSGGATLVGPAAMDGTLVLLGGRRALLRADGSLDVEKVPSPEPLIEIVEVPGEHREVIARSEHGVFRVDDPLGPLVALARSEDELVRLDAAPGVGVTWGKHASSPRFVRVAAAPSGGGDRESGLPGLPVLPLRSVAFLDAKRGAAIFEAVGLAVTMDGGATWRPPTDAGSAEALGARRVRVRSGALHASVWDDGPELTVDAVGARVGRFAFTAPTTQSPLLQWIQSTGEDPLAAVASVGVDLPDGRALVASHGLVARVDPRTGAVDGVVDVTDGKGGLGFGGSGRVAKSLWIACAVDDPRPGMFDPFGVLTVPLEAPYRRHAPELVRNGGAQLRVSPSGGVMMLAACHNDEAGGACVRQPDGTWKTLGVDDALAERGVAPLADGRIAFLRGLRPNEAAQTPLHVAVLGVDGTEHALAPIPFGLSQGHVAVESAVEEDVDHTLRFVVADGETLATVVVHPDKDSVDVHPIEGMTAARLHAGRGIAVGAAGVASSLDGGLTWRALPTPPRIGRERFTEGEDEIRVSEIGAQIGRVLRIGWGPSDSESDAPPASRNPELGPPIAWSRPSRPSTRRVLTCTSQASSKGVAPLASGAQVRQLLEAPHPAKPGERRESAVWSGSRSGMVDAALLEETGDAAARAPSRWTLRWHDPREIGGRARSAVIPVPEGATWASSFRFAAASGPRAVVALRSGTKVHLVRVRASGLVDVSEIASDLLPLRDLTFGEGRSDPVAWAHESLVLAWLPGERPRVIGRLAPTDERWIGAPSSTGVPVVVGSSDWAALRTFVIPPLEKGAASLPAAAAPMLDGWARLPPRVLDLQSLPTCAPDPGAAASFVVGRSLAAEGGQGVTRIDGVLAAQADAVYYVRVRGADACVAGIVASFGGSRKTSTGGAFVRADLLGKRAEGGERGVAPAFIRHMRCDLHDKPVEP